jgi:hypothetical protein
MNNSFLILILNLKLKKKKPSSLRDQSLNITNEIYKWCVIWAGIGYWKSAWRGAGGLKVEVNL